MAPEVAGISNIRVVAVDCMCLLFPYKYQFAESLMSIADIAERKSAIPVNHAIK